MEGPSVSTGFPSFTLMFFKSFQRSKIMTKNLFLGFFLLNSFLFYSQEEAHNLVLWYEEPAEGWLESLPLGNGRLGAMVYGAVDEDHLQLNEESLWAGMPQDPYPKDVKRHYSKFQQLNFEGKIEEALDYGMQNLAVAPTGIRSYEPLGELFIQYDHEDQVQDYRRELNLENGISTVEYEINGHTYKRESFISVKYDVVFYKFSTTNGEPINSTIYFDREKDIVQTIGSDKMLYIDGQVFDDPKGYDDNPGGSGKGGYHMKFAANIAVKPVDGDLLVEGNKLIVENSTNFIVVVSAATNYIPEILDFDSSIDPVEKAAKTLSEALVVSYDDAKKEHIKKHSGMFNRVQFRICGPKLDTIPTNKRMGLVENGQNDNHLTELFFQYGRYLLMNSSAGRAQLPANLQGIWSEDMWAPWEADYHLNINLQMNYWPADLTNLSETFIPLSNFMKRLADRGKTTAEKFIGSEGWMAHHATNPFGRTTPSGSTEVSQVINGYSFPLAGAWMSLSLWRHYQFTQDKEYLEETAYPVISGAATFILDFLKENDKGELVTAPSYSPENAYIDPETGEELKNTTAAAIDVQIIRDVFRAVLYSEKILGKHKLTGRIEKAIKKLPKTKIGADGTIQEWYEDYKEAEPGHRHISHLYALYPSNQITKKTPRFFGAAEKTIERRLSFSEGQVGWSRAWVINFYARLFKGDQALEHINIMMRNQLAPNMFDLIGKKIFQIDGNLGATAGIAEMLLQSHVENTIYLLPALPKEWSTGSIEGLKARGGFEVGMNWENGILTKANIYSTKGGKTIIKYGNKTWNLYLKPGERRTLVEL